MKGMMMAAVAGLALGAAAMALVGGTGASPAPTSDRAAIEAIVHDYILAHPEIIPEAVQKLQDRQAAKTIDDNRQALETPFPGALAGNPRGDVVLVEFTDYACGFCRASVPDLERLLREDKGLKIVYREVPVLGPESEVAAKAALAAARQGKHAAFHAGLFGAGPLSDATLARTEAQLGLNAGQPAHDSADPAIARELDGNLALARAIQLSGTPTFIVGDQMFNGAVGYDTLRRAIATARAGSAP